MNSVVEKFVAIEQEVAALQPKMVPLTERIADLDQKVAGFAQQLNDLAAESAAVKQDIELTRNGLARIQSLIGESKIDTEQLAAAQEENQQRYKAMESFVGTLYQLHSQSVQIAQWLGLTDQAKAVFPAPPSVPATLAPIALPVSPVAELPKESPVSVEPPMPEAVAKAVPEEKPAEELPPPPIAAPALPIPENVAEAMPTEPSVAEELPPPVAVSDLPMPPIVDTPIPEELPIAGSVLSESDFDAAISGTGDKALDPLGMPGLPNVAALPEMEAAPSDTDDDEADDDPDTEPPDAEPSEEMASHLDVPPLNLAAPAMPAQTEAAPTDEEDDQDIEAMLAAMGAPVTVGT